MIKMKKTNNIRYDLLNLMNKHNGVQTKSKRKKLLKQATKIIENKSLGILLLTEIDKDGKDIIHSLTYKCDGIHTKKILSLLLEQVPEVKEKIKEILDEEDNESKTMINHMVRWTKDVWSNNFPKKTTCRKNNFWLRNKSILLRTKDDIWKKTIKGKKKFMTKRLVHIVDATA